MTISKTIGWLAAALATMSGISWTASAQSVPSCYSRLEPAGMARRAKERKAVERETRLPVVPTLASRAGALRTVPRIGSRTLVEPRDYFKVPSHVTSEEAGRIYGGMIYSDQWTAQQQDVGIYSFPVTDGSALRSEILGSDHVVQGGVYANGNYYFISYMSFMGMVFADLHTCDFETWEITRSLPVSVGSVPQDMAYDPTTGNVYGCFMNDNADGWVLGSLNLETGVRRHIKDLDIIILSVGVNSKGEWYGVGFDGNFYRFDKETGDRTLIGSTGRRPAYSASGCFDLKTDRFYWECIEVDSKAVLYEIDIESGAAEPVTSIAGNAELVGMFIPVPEAEDAAPAAVTDLAFGFADGDLDGQVTFTMPGMRFDGSAGLAGTLGYTLMVDSDRTFTGSGMPGEKVSVPVSVDAPGIHTANVTVSNDAGSSPVAMTQKWLGHDMPSEVVNVSLTPGEGYNDIILRWDAPEGSMNGGYIDPEAITYDIVRLPDNIKVASSIGDNEFRETVPEPETAMLYSYAVITLYNGIEGSTAVSAPISIGCMEPPFRNMISDETEFAYFRVIDANGDGETWGFDPAHQKARIKYSMANNFNTPMDDWLVAPRMRLKAGRMYRFAFDASCYQAYDPERIEARLGREATPDGMDITVIEPTVINWSDPRTIEGWINVGEDGVYFFGIHAISPADSFFLYVGNVAVEEGPVLGTPGFVTGLNAKGGEQGQLKATVSGTAPAVTVDGKALEDLSYIRIERDGEYVAELTGIVPGESFVYTDENGVQGDNTYSVTAVNGKGDGYVGTVSVYLGHDRPGLPRDVRAVHNGDNSVTVTWSAPSGSETGGWFDPEALTYTVLRANDEKELATGLRELSFTDPEAPLNGYNQEFYAYYVYAQSPAGYGYGQVSNTVVVGKPYKMPFVETFADGRVINDPWDVTVPEDSDGYWRLKLTGEYPDAVSQDPEGGLVSFIPEESGDCGTLTSGTIDVTDAVNPVVEFWWYYVPDSYDVVRLLLSKDGGDFLEIADARAAAIRDEAGWRKVSTRLGDLEDVSYIQIAFDVTSGTGYNNLHIDNIRVKNVYDHNLAANSIQAPSRMKMGEESGVTVNIENNGLNAAEGYEVRLIANDEVIAVLEGPAIAADGLVPVRFDVVPAVTWPEDTYLRGEVVYGADMDSRDNSTGDRGVRVMLPVLPYINDLAGSLDGNGNAVLSWSEPLVSGDSGEAVTDGAEDYRQFSITGFGDWWTVDADGQPTFGIANNTGGAIQYENAGKPQAFMVFNPSAAGIPVEYSDGTPTDWAPRTGDQYFASFGNDGQSDNWLISPELPGIAQTISFFVKSQTIQYGFEKFEVYCSTGSAEIQDFVRIGDLRSAPAVWVEEKVDLPDGARYFAIRCVSQDAYVLMVDDVTYLPAAAYTGELALMGYNIYRDSSLLNDVPTMEMMFTDNTGDGMFHTYAVSTVYDKGESRLSNTVRLKSSGVDAAGCANVSVTSGRGYLSVDAPEGMRIAIASADGVRLYDTLSEGDGRFEMPAGVYLVTVGRTTVKVMVR